MTQEQNPLVVAHNAISMARAMRNLGRPARAVAKYDEAIAALPEFIEALDECLAVLESIGDWQGIADRCATWVALFPDHATHAEADRIHSRRVDALCRLGGIELALEVHGLQPVARTDLVIGDDEILAVIGLRDESARLPHVLAHHRRLGVDRFVVVDNGSSDGSLEYLVDQPDTIVWRTESSYRGANCGAVWWDLLLRRHARGNWCLIVDADEWFIYPHWETRRIDDLCAELDRQRVTCYPAVFLDMYGSGRLSESIIEPDRDLLDTFGYFDRNWYRMRRGLAGPRRNLLNHWGGVRARIFGDRALDSYLLDKVPLFRHHPGDVLLSGNHWTSRPSAQIADGRGVLLHFKYDSEFAALIAREVERGEHAGAARAYRRIADELDVDGDPCLFHPTYSLHLDSSEQLLRLGIMRPDSADARYPDVAERLTPTVMSAPPNVEAVHEPFWSMILIADTDAVQDQLVEVLAALEGEPASEIVVVVTADTSGAELVLPPSVEHHLRIESTELHLTEMERINLGVAAARGTWVHVLRDGAAITRGAHAAARRAIAAAGPEVTVAAAGPVGPLDLPLDLPPEAILVRRDCFTELGGFVTTIAASSTWELVQRFTGSAARALACLPSPLSFPDGAVAPAAALEFGEDISHHHLAVELVADRLDLDQAAVGSLRDRCANLAARRIIEDIERGSVGSALSILAEILRAPLSEAGRDELIELVSRRIR